MPTRARDTNDDQLIDDLRLINSELQRIGLPAWLELGLPAAQLKALVAIANSSGVSIGGLAQSLSVGEPAASQLVEQLVRRGYAERVPDPDDRRRVVVTATQTGADLVAELLQGRRQHVHEWLARMDRADVNALARGLHALRVAALGE